jgi:hypothetical protein
VTVWTGGRRQTREVYGGLGHAGHRDDADCRFGVGSVMKVDRIDVRWPDAVNATDSFADIPTGDFYSLQRNELLRHAN